ncbi:hypothetical protein DFH28DRAFT_907344 [Melampsora americana]|nr:hypothetical protein DFH28DRAFT_907344 [Melampsora americana]
MSNNSHPSQSPGYHLRPGSTPYMDTLGTSAVVNTPSSHSKKLDASAIRPQPYFTTKDELILWRQKQKEAEELNARIETLRLSGMPEDQLPSPVRLPITPLLNDLAEYRVSSRAATSVGRSTRPSSPAYPVRSASVSQAPLDSQSTLKRAPLKDYSAKLVSNHRPVRSVEQSPGLIMTSASIPGALADRVDLPKSSTDQSPEYFNALKEAETIITQLRSSHDNLLIKVTELESQLDQLEGENQSLRTRTQQLESWLADEEKEKEKTRAADEQRLRAKAEADAHQHREAQARADAQVRADRQARTEAQTRMDNQSRGHQVEGMTRAEAQAKADVHGTSQTNRHPGLATRSMTQDHHTGAAQLRAKLQLRDQELGKQAARPPLNIGSYPELTFAQGPPLARANRHKGYYDVPTARLKHSTSFSSAPLPPRPYGYAPRVMSEEDEVWQVAQAKHQEALSRVNGIYRGDVYGEVEWPLSSTNYGPHPDPYYTSHFDQRKY